MSFGIQSTGAAGGASSWFGQSGPSLRPFANLNLTEQQRQQIRQIFQTAKSQGTSQSDVQSQIKGVLTTAQQQQLQTDLQSQATSGQGQNGQNAPANPFANLGLTSSQQAQIQQIFQNAQSQGTSQSDLQSQIDAVLTPAQQQQLQANLQLGAGSASSGSTNLTNQTLPPVFANLNLTATQQSQIQQILQGAQSQGSSQTDLQSQTNAILTPAQQQQLQANLQQFGIGSSSSSSTDQTLPPIFANLNLTADQKTQIQSILANTQSQGLSPAQVKSEINSVLTTSQLQLLQQNVQNAQAGNAGRNTTSSDAGSSQGNNSSTATTSSTSEATLSNGLTVSDIQKQVAAALSLLLKQIESEVGTAPTPTASST